MAALSADPPALSPPTKPWGSGNRHGVDPIAEEQAQRGDLESVQLGHSCAVRHHEIDVLGLQSRIRDR
ncbi:hypothetical protein Q0F99_17960 [Rathayibacter oskolensis]|nr:hypothetical protein [Rathayibacter oskolensis]WKK71312.1 hypothetical protein Q0F99_17960 [Rathayibacter oskolensis]